MTGNAEKLMKMFHENAVVARDSIGISMADIFDAIEELIREGVIEEPYSQGVTFPTKGCVVTE